MAQGNESEGQKLSAFWAKTQSLIESLKAQYPELNHVHAYVKLNKERLRNTSLNQLIKKLATELVSFVSKASETATSNSIIILDWDERTFDEFTGYPTMETYVKQVRIRKGYARWHANANRCYVGINTQLLAEIIRDKNNKARRYDRHNLDQLWLLIAAPHHNVSNAMHGFPDEIDFDAQAILDACASTPFDKIFFWSSPPHEWYRQIWPNDANAHL